MLLGHEKINFLNLPTPLDYLENVSKDLGINVYCKRDDLTGLGVGGNKLRKLEYFLKDAMDKGATMLITEGGAQTNHGRLTAAVATKYGLKCAIVTADEYPGEISANLLLDGIMGCDVHFVKDMREGRRKVIDRYTAKGEKVYYIPMGGSNELGILGYVECASELDMQARELGIENATVYVTVGSLGTYLGLLIGLRRCASSLSLKGISVLPYGKNGNDQKNLIACLKDYYERVRDFYSSDQAATDILCDFDELDINISTEYIHGAYNNPVEEVRETMYYLARKEAIIVDPCYTGKTFEAIVDCAAKGVIEPGTDVIFMHTGGLPGIYTKHHRVELEKELMPYMHIEDF